MHRLTLRHKLYLTVAPLMLMGAVISLITWKSLRENATPLIEAQQLRDLASSSLLLVRTQDDAIKTMMLDPDNPSSNVRKIKAYDENRRVLNLIAKSNTVPEVRQTIKRMAELDANVLQDIDTAVLESLGDGKAEKARQLYFGSYEPQRAKYEAYVQRLVSIAEVQSKIAEKQLYQSNANSLRSILTALAVGLLLVALCVTLLARSIAAAMKRVVSRLTEEYDAARQTTDLIGEASRSLSDGVSSTSAAIHDIDGSVADFGVGLQATSDRARLAQESSTKAVENADRASEAIQLLLVASKEAQTSSDKIVSIIKTIDDISFKTNILALNAAVEAARAGEAGLGFSVVADEVRNLARSSAAAARETADLIQNSIAKSKQGVTMSERAARALTNAISESHRIHTVIGEIAVHSRSQSENILQINASLSHIGSVGQQSAQEAEKTRGVAETLRQRSNSMREVIDELMALVGVPAA